jgi:hypothetical protein
MMLKVGGKKLLLQGKFMSFWKKPFLDKNGQECA